MPLNIALSAPSLSKKGWWASFVEMIQPPEDISEHGHLIDWLFNYTTLLNLFFFALVCLGLFGFCYLYSHKRHPKPLYTYGNKKIHVLTATLIGVAVFLGIDMNITRMSNNDFINVFSNWPSEKGTLRVQVLAQQWMWSFRYAGEDEVFNTRDDITTVNDLRVPQGKKILFQILSKDVIHSLYFPNARRKTDAIPGRITRMWIQFNRPGTFDIACAEMCGVYHYRMAAQLTVYAKEDFHHWLGESQKIALALNDPKNPDIYWGWPWP